jgi:hydrogenase expression/formation protein HypC
MCLGVPGRIVAITDASRELALVDIAGVRREINISCVVDRRAPEACVGDWVLVHVGFAMSRLDEDEARKTLALLRELDALRDEAPTEMNVGRFP